MAGGLATAVALGFATFLQCHRAPVADGIAHRVPEHVRGTVMGLTVTCYSIGWLSAAALGGWMIGGFGFAGLGRWPRSLRSSAVGSHSSGPVEAARRCGQGVARSRICRSSATAAKTRDHRPSLLSVVSCPRFEPAKAGAETPK